MVFGRVDLSEGLDNDERVGREGDGVRHISSFIRGVREVVGTHRTDRHHQQHLMASNLVEYTPRVSRSCRRLRGEFHPVVLGHVMPQEPAQRVDVALELSGERERE
jgi:hypothetical protein